MKTLDEVIKSYELQMGEKRCEDCSYCDDCYDHHSCECPYRDADALHYLKAFRDAKNALEAEKERYAEAVRNCEEAENKYKALELGYIRATADIEDNPPLTWDELRQMVGEPVWIDSVPLVRRWVIIKKFHPIGGNKNLYDMEVEDGAHFLRKNMRRDDPAWWQAYRKERNEDA